jgi:cation:H+ antiporter
LAILFIIGGLILLAVGAEGLVRGSSAIAARLGIAPLVIGLTVVAFGTGSPELFVSVGAALSGNSSIALGNVIGSNISNIALILGIAAIVRPLRVRAEIVRREVPVMIGASLLLWFLLLDGALGRIEGLLLTACAAGYTFFNYHLAKTNKQEFVEDEFAEALEQPKKPLWLDIAFALGGLMTLLVGANFLLGGAVTVAESFGISQIVIGLTIIAVGTSLPELATSVAATIKNESDVALGNAIGSNTLNIFCILGLTALIQPISAADVRTVDLVVMVGTALLGLFLLWRGFVLNRLEGAVLVIGYIIYIYSLLH